MAKGRLSEEQFVEKSVYEFGPKFAKSLEPGLEIIKQYTLEIGKMNAQYKDVSSINGFVKIKQRENDVIEQVTVAKKLQSQIELNLIKTQERKKLVTESTNKALIRERTEVNRLNKLEREAAVLKSKTSSAMDKAIVTRRKLIRTIQDLQAKQALGNKLSDKEQKELKQSTREFLKYDKAINIAKKSTGQFQENVGNYPKFMSGAIQSFKTLIPLIGAGFGLREAWNFTQESIQLARDAKGVEFAFQRIEERTQMAESAFQQIKRVTRGLLSDLDIKKSIVEFDNFNLETDQLATVLEFVAVRATQTGKSFEYLRDSAIEAISKESVRRADNLGLSQKELNDKIKEGATFLEAFADIAQREIGEAGDVLDEAANAQARLNAAMTNFKITVGDGVIGSFFTSFIEETTEAVEFWNRLAESSDKALDREKMERYNSELSILKSQLDKLSENSRANFLKSLSENAEDLQNSIADIPSKLVRISELNKLIKNAGTEKGGLIIEKNLLESEVKNLTQLEGKLKALNEVLKIYSPSEDTKKGVMTIADLRIEIEKLTAQREEIERTDKSGALALTRKIELYEEEIRSLTQISKIKQNNAAFELSKFRLEQEIKIQDEIIKNQESSSAEVLKAILAKEELEVQLAEEKEAHLLSKQNITADERILIEEKTSAALVEIYKKTNQAIDDLKKRDLVSAGEADNEVSLLPDEEAIEEDRRIFQEGVKILKSRYKDLVKSMGMDSDGLFDKLSENYDGDFQAYLNHLEKVEEAHKQSSRVRQEIEREFANATMGIVNGLFDSKIQSFDNQLYELENRYALEYDLAEGNERQQKLIRLREEKEKKELEKRRAKELRKQAIFNKLMAVGEIGVNLGVTISNLNKAATAIDAITFGQGGKFYLARNLPFAIATAALQTASVIAQPIPKYAKGTDDHKGGFALVGEERPEVIIEPGKDPYIISRPTVLDLPKHTEVVPSLDEYQKLFAGSQMASLEMNARKANTYRKSQEAFNNTQMATLIEQNKQLIDITKKKKTNVNVHNNNNIDLGYLKFREDNISWS